MKVICPNCKTEQKDWSYDNKCECGCKFICRYDENGKFVVEPKQ